MQINIKLVAETVDIMVSAFFYVNKSYYKTRFLRKSSAVFINILIKRIVKVICKIHKYPPE